MGKWRASEAQLQGGKSWTFHNFNCRNKTLQSTNSNAHSNISYNDPFHCSQYTQIKYSMRKMKIIPYFLSQRTINRGLHFIRVLYHHSNTCFTLFMINQLKPMVKIRYLHCYKFCLTWKVQPTHKNSKLPWLSIRKANFTISLLQIY